MKNQFDLKLDECKQKIIELGALCEYRIEHVLDPQLVEDINDNRIDVLVRSIEDMCLSLLLQYQPVASDLRFISATLKMITDIQRIGKQTQDITEILNTIQVENLKQNSGKIMDMANLCKGMVHDCVDAFVKRDTMTARQVIQSDDIVDEAFEWTKQAFIQKLTIGEDVLDLLLIAKYFEKIGDHACSIAKWIIFSITGEHVEG